MSECTELSLDAKLRKDIPKEILGTLRYMLQAEEGAPTRIEAWNKVDLVSAVDRERLDEEAKRRDDVVPISALTGEGLDALRERIAERLRRGEQVHQVRLPASAGERIAWLHSRGEVLEQRVEDDALELSVRLSPENWARFQAMESA